LEYQGFKFLSRFDPITYLKLTEQMDTHDVGRNRGGKTNALSSVRIPAMVLGIDSDILYPIHDQEELAKLFPNGELAVIYSDAGHDGFLLEQEQVAAHITGFLGAHD
jgi:homoserine O-acetyltransferase